ncbi:hypothetical protein [Vibrio splendidus]|uniref:hypothetical protein n=1 Tax=Vibrio splendidus TaxID=29497 RepID=UPI000D3BCCE4|nr:hypothetical protein [Vibrio splendidus]PTP42745.1 hypothetical protein CWN87_13010 [Vibrio splendidus]
MNIAVSKCKSSDCSSRDLSAFRTELDLVLRFEELVTSRISSNFKLEKEFDCGFGIADAVLFKYRDIEIDRLSKINPSWAYTLKSLPYRRTFSTKDVVDISGATTQSCKLALKQFIEAGYCVEKRDDVYVKVKQPKPVSNKIVAIEAKLKNWKRALWQASRYKTFSNESWVLLDRKHVKPALENIDVFKKFNIGLATFSTDTCYEVFFKPKIDVHKSEIAYWKANTILAQRIIN